MYLLFTNLVRERSFVSIQSIINRELSTRFDISAKINLEKEFI